MKNKCPCCGCYTLEEDYGSYEICPVCFWEEDPAAQKNPNIVFGGNRHLPAFENVERKGRCGIHLMIGTVHDEIHTGGNLAEFTDNQLIATKIVMVRHVLFKIRIAEVRKVADKDIRILYLRFNICDRFTIWNRK